MAKRSMGTHTLAFSFEIKSLIKPSSELEVQIKTTELTLEELLLSCNTTILSIPGISVELGAMILGEIGDISRFGSPKMLLAHAGLED